MEDDRADLFCLRFSHFLQRASSDRSNKRKKGKKDRDARRRPRGRANWRLRCKNRFFSWRKRPEWRGRREQKHERVYT